MRCRAATHERERIDWLPGAPSGLCRQDLRLVKPAGEKPPSGERHRYEQIGVGKQFAAGLREPPSKKAPGIVTIVEFEPMNENAHQPVEASNGSCAIVVRRIRDGGGREHWTTGIERHGHAKTVTEGRSDEIDPPPARRTEGVVIHDPGLAAETERRQQHVEGCAPKSGERTEPG